MTSNNINKEEEKNVEQCLRDIARLQRALTSIDKIRTLRGELPLEVRDIEDDIAGTQTRLEYMSTAAKALTQSVAGEKNKIAGTKELLQKYHRQIEHVRNNREYDNLNKEIEFQELEVQASEKKIREYTAELQARKTDIANLKAKIELRQGDLAAKKAVLENIIKETQEEENKLIQKAEELESKITDKRLLTAFHRIRNASRNGLAVVPIDRDACGGCFNRIPPQRQHEIRLAQKIIVCEYCGRIIVDPQYLLSEEEQLKIAQMTSQEAEQAEAAAAPKKKTTRAKAATGEEKPKRATRKTKKEADEEEA